MVMVTFSPKRKPTSVSAQNQYGLESDLRRSKEPPGTPHGDQIPIYVPSGWAGPVWLTVQNFLRAIKPFCSVTIGRG